MSDGAGQRRSAGRWWLGGLRREQSGETLISFALTVPILFGVIFGLMEMCLAYYNYERISELAREGTRYAIFRGATCKLSSGASCEAATTDVTTYVNAVGLPNMGGGTTTVVTSYPSGNENVGSLVKVVVSYSYPFKIPFMKTSAIAMSSTSEMNILQ